MRAYRFKLSIACLLVFLSTSAAAVRPGDLAPDFERVPLRGGTPIALEDYRGKVVVVDFWASWCAPCRKSMPFLSDLYKKHRSKGFEVLAVNLDTRINKALRFLRDYPVEYPILHDDGRLPERYGVIGMPTSFYIDRKGIVRLIHIGFDNSDHNDVRDVVLGLLEEKHEQKAMP